uniref:Si:dkey-71d15.2 n=2 Tax=Iconisemion striatum TaxID=60296 RepID=A0A1A7WIV9_9TELE
MGNYSSALIPDTEEFESIASVVKVASEPGADAGAEKFQSELQTLVKRLIEEEKRESEAMNSSTHQGTSHNSSLQAADKSVPMESFSSLLPKALSAVLHPAVNSEHSPEGNPKPNLEQLQTELKVLRDQFELMKSQHNKEIQLLMNELDEEKRIRLTLQMEIQRMKKHMSK